MIPSDPISSQKVPGGNHVGKSVYVSKPTRLAAISPPNFTGHEPAVLREYLVAGLNDSRIPPSAWQTHQMPEITPERDKQGKGTVEEYLKLAASIERYYQARDIHFDSQAFNADFELFLEILGSD